MKAIVAVNENWGIGCNGALLYTIPEDMQFFKEKTEGKVVVMGYFTFVDLPGSKPLKNRTNIILFDDPELSVDGALVCNSTEQLFDTLSSYDTDDVFIIGGQAVYEQFFEYCSTIYVTKVEDQKAADRHFPNLDELPNWEITSTSEEKEHEGLKFTFCEYTNTDIKPALS